MTPYNPNNQMRRPMPAPGQPGQAAQVGGNAQQAPSGGQPTGLPAGWAQTMPQGASASGGGPTQQSSQMGYGGAPMSPGAAQIIGQNSQYGGGVQPPSSMSQWANRGQGGPQQSSITGQNSQMKPGGMMPPPGVPQQSPSALNASQIASVQGALAGAPQNVNQKAPLPPGVTEQASGNMLPSSSAQQPATPTQSTPVTTPRPNQPQSVGMPNRPNRRPQGL